MNKKVLVSILLVIMCCVNMLAYADGTVTVAERIIDGKQTVMLMSDEDMVVNVYAATYTEQGLLDSISIQPQLSLTANEEKETSFADLNESTKIFVWDDELHPLAAEYIPGTNITEEPPVEETPVGDGIIHLKGTTVDAAGVAGVTVDETEDGNVVTITDVGDYVVEGTLTDGQLVVSDSLGKKDEVNITLQGVDITSSNSAPFNGGGGAITLILADGTRNVFTDTAKYSAYTTEKDPKGCVYARRDFDIEGSGTLVVNGNVKNGLVCGADLKIKKGANIDVTAVNNGIKGDNGVEFTDKTGNVTVKTTEGDAIKSDAIIELDDGTLLIEPDKGYVTIDGGTFVLNAGGDGIQADNICTVSGGTITINAGNEGIKANEVMLWATEDEETQMVDDAGELMFVNGAIAISGGTINITSAEDGIKACESLDISGGSITVCANGAEADGIQVGESTKTEETASSGAVTTTETIVIPGVINISGGEIIITEATDDGIVCRGDFIMTDGSVSGKATCDFMKVYNLVDISGGGFDITAGNDGIQSGKELVETVSGSTVTESEPTAGNLTISGGKFNIITNGGHTTTMSDTDPSAKGIKAITELTITDGEFTIDSADDAIHSNYNLTVTGGTFNLATGDDGLHADYILTMGTEGGSDDDYTIDISTSYEGVEGSVINILSGTSYVYSTDDGINAAGDYDENGNLSSSGSSSSGSTNQWGGWGPSQGMDETSPYGMLYVKGGKIYVEANGDGMDSNGSIDMSGGVVIINGPSSGGNGVFDIGESNATFKITGGTLIGAGSSDMAVTPTSISNGYFLNGKSSNSSSGGRPSFGGNSQGSSSSSSYAAGTPVKVTTSNGYIIFVPKVKSPWLFVTTPEMNNGGSFTATTVSSYSGGTQILGKTINGVFYGLVEGAE